jgi:hypothetical protein
MKLINKLKNYIFKDKDAVANNIVNSLNKRVDYIELYNKLSVFSDELFQYRMDHRPFDANLNKNLHSLQDSINNARYTIKDLTRIDENTYMPFIKEI